MATSRSYWKVASNLAYFGSGVIAATAITNYKIRPEEGKGETEVCRTRNADIGITAVANGVSGTLLRRSQNQAKERNLQSFQHRLAQSIKKAEKLCQRLKARHGLPGLSIAVSVNGTTEWTRGFGYADLENEVKMGPESVVRIGSISKPMTMAMLGRLMEDNKIDLDLPVQTYVPNFPKKEVGGKEVVITTRHLLSHLSGIRHYATKEEIAAKTDEMSLKEYFLKEKFESVDKALELFQNDQLLHEPGTKFEYTTHGWTLVSAVLEKISGTPFDKHAKSIFKTWGLKHTFLDEPEPIIYHRARPYSCDPKRHVVQNAPYVDNSYKWAGGGFLSNVGDLIQFGNIMLASFQNDCPENSEVKTENHNGGSTSVHEQSNRPYLKRDIVAEMWRGDPRTVRPGREFLYGLGFMVAEPMRKCFFCHSRDLMTVTHGGAAIGGTSVLLLTFPKDTKFGYDQPDMTDTSTNSITPNGQVKGVVVSMLTNVTHGGLAETAQEITKLFEWLI